MSNDTNITFQARGETLRLGMVSMLASAAFLLAGAAMAQDNTAPLFDLLPDAIKASGTIQVAGDPFPPYRIISVDGETRTGLEADLLEAMVPLLGVEFENTIVASLPAMLAGLDTGRYDLTTGPLLDTVEREERFDIIPWLLSKPAYVMDGSASETVKVLEDLCGLRVAFSAGSISEQYQTMVSDRCIAAGKPPLVDVALQDKNTLLLAVQSNRADAMSSQLASALYMQAQLPDQLYIQTDETDQLGILHLGLVLKSKSELSGAIVEALRMLNESGEYAAILTRWGLGAAAQPDFELNPASK